MIASEKLNCQTHNCLKQTFEHRKLKVGCFVRREIIERPLETLGSSPFGVLLEQLKIGSCFHQVVDHVSVSDYKRFFFVEERLTDMSFSRCKRRNVRDCFIIRRLFSALLSTFFSPQCIDN